MFHSKAIYYFNINDHANAYHYSLKEKDILFNNRWLIKQNIIGYIGSLNNHIFYCFKLGKYDEVKTLIDETRKIPILFPILSNTDVEFRIFRTFYPLEIELYTCLGDIKKILEILLQFENGINHYKKKINDTALVISTFTLASAYFTCSDYTNSIKHVNTILSLSAKNLLRIDILCFTRIINLIIHYELGNKELLEYTAVSVYRFLYKKERLYQTEKIFLDFIKLKLHKLFTEKQVIEAFKELKDELTELTKDPYEKRFLEGFDLISWLQSKIENRPFAEVVKENFAKEIATSK